MLVGCASSVVTTMFIHRSYPAHTELHTETILAEPIAAEPIEAVAVDVHVNTRVCQDGTFIVARAPDFKNTVFVGDTSCCCELKLKILP